MVTVGVPRALLYYEFFPLWEKFFQSLGVEVVTSRPTTKHTLNRGVSVAVDETCLPIKIMYGHYLELCEQCDFIFLPRLISVEPRSYICPKFMGLPDLLRDLRPQPLIEPTIDLRSRNHYWLRLWSAAHETATKIGFTSHTDVSLALFRGIQAQVCFRSQLHSGIMPFEVLDSNHKSSHAPTGTKIGLIGHPYTLFDEINNMGIFSRLREAACQVVTPVNYSAHQLNALARRLPKDLFWTYGRRMVGAARYWYQNNLVDGIIHLVSFGCGTDSLTGELIERLAKRESSTPFMLLTIDEHTGEAGFRTRLEAFLDMINFRQSMSGGKVW